LKNVVVFFLLARFLGGATFRLSLKKNAMFDFYSKIEKRRDILGVRRAFCPFSWAFSTLLLFWA
jgi:hypothetical protein